MRASSVVVSSSLLILAAGCFAACGSDDGETPPPATSSAGAGGTGGAAAGIDGTTLAFDPTADLHDPTHFYDAPYPSDLRLANGSPDLAGFPTTDKGQQVTMLRDVISRGKGFPVVPVAYFHASAKMPELDSTAVIPADASSNVLLVDVDASGPEQGRLIPTVATIPPKDVYVPSNVLAVAARPGFVLRGHRTYAFVVKRALGDRTGAPLGSPASFEALKADTARADATTQLYGKLWDTLGKIGVAKADVAAATVFTTGDVVQDLADLSDQVVADYDVTIDGLHVDPKDGKDHEGYCELVGTVTLPQFQGGTPPFDTDGLFVVGDDGKLVKQRDETVPITVTLPFGTMPANGYPLVQYFHGSGGLSTAIVDRGTWHVESDKTKCPEGTLETWLTTQGCNTTGEGPAWVLAPFGFAMFNAALPVNPERLPGASETAYLNLGNLAMGRDLFRQGVLEERLILEAMTKIQIDPTAWAGCDQVVVDGGGPAKFDASQVFAQGQSMGGQYTNMYSAVEPLVKGSVPTGAGGFWSYFILVTQLIPNVGQVIGPILLGTDADLTFMHPALHVFETAWEPVEPMVYMPRLAHDPLNGHAPRPIYEPVGKGDSYFPSDVYDAMSLAYDHQEVGDVVWDTMQPALKLEGADGIQPYPTSQNRTSLAGAPYTGIVVQYEGDGIYDPHALYSQLDVVKHQYGCFLASMLNGGTAKVVAPAPRGSACE